MMRTHDLTNKKIMTKKITKTKNLETCDNCDMSNTVNNSDDWEPEFMTIFVTWQLRVTLDSICNSYDVWKVRNYVREVLHSCDVFKFRFCTHDAQSQEYGCSKSSLINFKLFVSLPLDTSCGRQRHSFLQCIVSPWCNFVIQKYKMAQKSNITKSHDTCLKPPQRNPPQWLHQVGCLKLVSTREWGMLACICMSPSL